MAPPRLEQARPWFLGVPRGPLSHFVLCLSPHLTQGTCQSCGVTGPNLWACLQVRGVCSCWGCGAQSRHGRGHSSLVGTARSLGQGQGHQGMDALGGVPKLREIHGQRVPGLAALAAIKNEKSKERAGDDSGRDDRTFAEGTVLHRCARLREVSRSEPWLLEQQPVREPAWAFVSHRYSRGRDADGCPRLLWLGYNLMRRCLRWV